MIPTVFAKGIWVSVYYLGPQISVYFYLSYKSSKNFIWDKRNFLAISPKWQNYLFETAKLNRKYYESWSTVFISKLNTAKN